MGKPNGNSSTKVVVFGVDGDCKPHAAWFPKDQADTARAAAKQLRFNVIEVTNGIAADLVAKLPPGRIHANGPGRRARQSEKTCTKKSWQRSMQEAKPAANRASRSPVTMPTSWDAIKPGHVVLTHDSWLDGWWAHVVVARTGDKLTLRWRDYPGWPKVNVRATAVALVNSAGS